MTLAIVLVGGWFLLSVLCFAMGTGMFRSAAAAVRPQVSVPAPRTARDGARVPVGV